MRTSFILAMALACARSQVHELSVDDAGSDSGPDAAVVETTADAGLDAGPITYSIQRVALHVHSAISHDACDHHSTDGGPLLSLDQDCLDQLEAALCSAKIDVAFLTDHPRYMDSKLLPDDLLLRGRGEQPLYDGQGNVNGMVLPCGTQVAAGGEGTPTHPLGLAP